ncbi:hypothetical protein [Capybara microvirus Cap1_SP_167]|nr:hypothetical protein [Capybara microvirus Cap1_SP_167]
MGLGKSLKRIAKKVERVYRNGRNAIPGYKQIFRSKPYKKLQHFVKKKGIDKAKKLGKALFTPASTGGTAVIASYGANSAVASQRRTLSQMTGGN